MEKYIEEKEVFDKIREVIYGMYPVKYPRVSFSEENYTYENNGLWITFNFYNDMMDKTNTQVMISRTGDFCGNSNCCLVNGEISKNTIGNLIRFLLVNFPYVNSLYTYSNGFKMDFGIGLEQHCMEGIGCSRVEVIFDTHPKLKDNFSKVFSDYLEYVMSTFQDEISKNPNCLKGCYKGYYDVLNPQMIKSFSSENLRDIANMLTDEEICNLLRNMSNERFFELCDKSKVGKTLSLSRKGTFNSNK